MYKCDKYVKFKHKIYGRFVSNIVTNTNNYCK